MSVPEFGAEPGRCAQGTAHAPLGPLGPPLGSRRLPRRPVQSNELAGGALLLRMREHVAVPLDGWLARYGCIWVMSLHLSSNV
jgi:hypothetical protein